MRGTGSNIRTRGGRVKRKVLADVIRRVVEAAQPDRIILFGSAARGEMRPNSDLDLLVIKGASSITGACLRTFTLTWPARTRPSMDGVLGLKKGLGF